MFSDSVASDSINVTVVDYHKVIVFPTSLGVHIQWNHNTVTVIMLFYALFIFFNCLRFSMHTSIAIYVHAFYTDMHAHTLNDQEEGKGLERRERERE